MELYYKDLISEDASLEELVDNLMLVVQGVDEVAQAAGARLSPDQRGEITSRLYRLKEGCRRLEQHAVSSALAAGKVVRQYPYSAVGFAFVAGMVVASVLKKRRAFRP